MAFLQFSGLNYKLMPRRECVCARTCAHAYTCAVQREPGEERPLHAHRLYNVHQQPCVLEEDLNVNFVCGPMVLEKAAYAGEICEFRDNFFFFKKSTIPLPKMLEFRNFIFRCNLSDLRTG